MKDLNLLPDIELKFDISVIFFLKRIQIQKGEIEKSLHDFKRLFYRQHSYGILKALLDSELLFAFIKAMENTRHLVHLDQYKKYSLDDYSMLCLYHLEHIEDSFVRSLHNDLCADGKVLMKFVVLMHEVAKTQGADGSNTGANIFRAYANKINLSPKATNMGVILIKNHTLMSSVANTEDIYSEQVMLNFISSIGDKQALKLLYILTYCTSNASSDGSYSAYSAKLLREVYDIATKSFEMSDENLLGEATRRVKKENLIRKNKTFLALSSSEQNSVLSIQSNLIFIKYQPAKIIDIALFARLCSNIDIKMENKNGFCIEIISKKGWNMPMVLSKLSNLDLAYMEIFELFDGKFYIKLEYNEALSKDKMQDMKSIIMSALCDKQKINVPKPLILASQISFDMDHSSHYARLNINAKDQRGFMAYLLSVFDSFCIEVANARIQTIKNRTRNLFLIQKTASLNNHYQDVLNCIITKE